MLMPVVNHIREIRQARDISIQRLAKRLCVDRSSIYCWERQDYQPQLEQVFWLLRELDCKFAELFTWTP